ncbi:MAG: hypothetical protein MJE77_00345 [Proteobacteria bacterium]|nr:hypothetical protein [Pseudomonadota bacterium]
MLGFVVALIGALVFLVIVVRSDSRATAQRSPHPATASSARSESAAPVAIERSAARPLTPQVADEVAETDRSAGQTGSPAVRRYVRPDGTAVRDHRAGKREVDLTRAIPAPAKLARLAPETLLAVRKAMLPIVDKCAKRLNGEEIGDKPRVQADIIVDIAGGQLAVQRTFIKARDVPEGLASALASCIEEPSEQLSLAVEEEGDVSSYTLTIPFRLSM